MTRTWLRLTAYYSFLFKVFAERPLRPLLVVQVYTGCGEYSFDWYVLKIAAGVLLLLLTRLVSWCLFGRRNCTWFSRSLLFLRFKSFYVFISNLGIMDSLELTWLSNWVFVCRMRDKFSLQELYSKSSIRLLCWWFILLYELVLYCSGVMTPIVM